MKKIIVILATLCFQRLCAQDPQFSQYYAAPLVLNPALAGSAHCQRVGFNARSQWTGLTKPFNTVSAYLDANLHEVRSGLGIMALHDNIGTARLSSNEIGLFYSYLVPVNKHFNVRMGIRANWVSRSLQYEQLLFEDQFDDLQVTQDYTHDPVAQHTQVSYVDFSSGLLFFGDNSYWLGFAAHHMNRPDQSFYIEGSRLPVTYSVHGGYNISFFKSHGLHNEVDRAVHLTPTFIYKSQAKFDQVDIGAYVLKTQVLYGIWYRGIFFKEDEGIRNNDALIVQIGLKPKNMSFIYSYDITTSKLRQRNTYGSHEISVVYEFCAKAPRKKHNYKRLPCPDFIKVQEYQRMQRKRAYD